MNIRKSLLLSVVAVALTAPGFSFAQSLWGPAKGDSGGNFLQDNFKSTKTRADVLQELETARKDGSLLSTSDLKRGLTAPAKTTESKLTRAEVQKELFAQSPEDKKLMKKLYGSR